MKTAVEWLYDQIENHGKCIYEVIEQAKAMEKEQMIRTHLMARCYDTPNSYNDAEQYYNETFKSE